MSQEDKPVSSHQQICNEIDRLTALSKPVEAQEPVGKLIDEGFRQIQWFSKPPIGTLLYAIAAPCARCKKLEAQVKDWKRGANAEAQEVDAAHAKITEQAARIKALESELSLIKPNSDCDSGCMLSCSMEGKANAATIERQRKVIEDAKAALMESRKWLPFQTTAAAMSAKSLAAIAELEKGVG